eukprot:gene24953-biopygen22440
MAGRGTHVRECGLPPELTGFGFVHKQTIGCVLCSLCHCEATHRPGYIGQGTCPSAPVPADGGAAVAVPRACVRACAWAGCRPSTRTHHMKSAGAHVPVWEKRRTRTGRGPHDRIQRNRRGPDADRTRGRGRFSQREKRRCPRP